MLHRNKREEHNMTSTVGRKSVQLVQINIRNTIEIGRVDYTLLITQCYVQLDTYHMLQLEVSQTARLIK